MKLSNFVMIFLCIFCCFAVVHFINIDITQKTDTLNSQYSTKLASACYDAAQSMDAKNIELYGNVWANTEHLNETLSVFYNSLIYSFNWDNAGRVNEMALYTPVVCLIDVDGYYISHNVVFNTSGTITAPSDMEKINAVSSKSTWTKNYNGVLLRYYLNDDVEVYTTNGTRLKGNRHELYKYIQDKYPASAEESELAFIVDDDLFNERKNELIIREINNQCEYYINKHNIIGQNNDYQYTFEMPEVSGEDWARLLQNPSVIAFLQGYSTTAEKRLLNVYALGGGELTRNYHYFIEGDIYHCAEAEPGVTKSTRVEVTSYESEGVTKTIETTYVVYEFNGHEIDVMYPNQTMCAQQGATPCECVYNWN